MCITNYGPRKLLKRHIIVYCPTSTATSYRQPPRPQATRVSGTINVLFGFKCYWMVKVLNFSSGVRGCWLIDCAKVCRDPET